MAGKCLCQTVVRVGAYRASQILLIQLGKGVGTGQLWLLQPLKDEHSQASVEKPQGLSQNSCRAFIREITTTIAVLHGKNSKTLETFQRKNSKDIRDVPMFTSGMG